MPPPPALQPLGRVKRGAEGRAATDKRYGGGLHATPGTAVAYLFLPTQVAGMPDAHVPETTLTPPSLAAQQARSSGRLQHSRCIRRRRTSQDINAYGVRAFQPFQDHEHSCSAQHFYALAGSNTPSSCEVITIEISPPVALPPSSALFPVHLPAGRTLQGSRKLPVLMVAVSPLLKK